MAAIEQRPGASTSSEPPPTPPMSGSPSTPGTCSWTSGSRPARPSSSPETASSAPGAEAEDDAVAKTGAGRASPLDLLKEVLNGLSKDAPGLNFNPVGGGLDGKPEGEPKPDKPGPPARPVPGGPPVAGRRRRSRERTRQGTEARQRPAHRLRRTQRLGQEPHQCYPPRQRAARQRRHRSDRRRLRALEPRDGRYEINSRSYGVEPNGTVFPDSGAGIAKLNRVEYSAPGDSQGERRSRQGQGVQQGPQYVNNPEAVAKAKAIHDGTYTP